jgi:hypothetical protein
LSSTQPATATTAKIHTITETPSGSARNTSRNSGTWTICVCRFAMTSASPRAPTIIASVAMNATTCP